ncbi:hypothetical protein [Bifidobacterium psychraerophilum]|uniref:hypothetical protein n=1 Tax=Bifidobacterium psychraerophilum TaxID=218140 RepID=UPI0039E933E4
MTRIRHRGGNVLLAIITAGVTLSAGGFGTALAADTAPAAYETAQHISTVGRANANDIIPFITGAGMGDSGSAPAQDDPHGAPDRASGKVTTAGIPDATPSVQGPVAALSGPIPGATAVEAALKPASVDIGRISARQLGKTGRAALAFALFAFAAVTGGGLIIACRKGLFSK